MGTEQKLAEMIRSIVGEELREFITEQRALRKGLGELLAVRKEEPKPQEKGINAARFLRALAAGRGDISKAAKYAQKVWGEDSSVYKAMTASELTEGGYLVPEEYSSEVVELLTAKAVVRKMGATTIPMDTGTVNIPKITGGATAYYIGESTNIPASKLTTGQLKLTWKKLASLVPISNDLLRFSSPKADVIVRQSLVNSMALKEDIAFIRGTGTEYTPKGLRFWAREGNVFSISTDNGQVTVETVLNDLLKAIYKLKVANCNFDRPGWVFSPRTEFFLKSLRDPASGQLVFKEEMDNGLLLGFPYATTTQIPDNLGTGENESEIYFADFSEAVIGESTRFIIDVSTEAAYIDETTSTLVSAFSRDETVMRVIAQHDFGMRHDEAVAVITGVTWGSPLSL